MSIFVVIACISLLILLITKGKINAFLAFLIVSILAGLLLGVEISSIAKSIQKGIGDMLGSLVIIIIAGAMLGKLVADSGAAQQIANGMMKVFGEKYIQWAFMVTGFVIGIPLFFNVGFVLVVPLIFSVAFRYKLPVLYVGMPLVAALSVTHGFLPPHPGPTALVAQFHADMGMTLFYGIIISIPTIIISGFVFSKTLKSINVTLPKTFQSVTLSDQSLPSLANSIFSAILPVAFLAIATVVTPRISGDGMLKHLFLFLSDPAMVMLISLGIATYSLGLKMDMSMVKIMNIYGEAVKDMAMLLLIMGGAGALKQILLDSGVSSDIAGALSGLDIHPLILGWMIACIIRLCVGSATVAALTAAGIVAPFLSRPDIDPNLMVLSVGAGSLLFSHVNDSGFWLVKEYFNMTIKDTIRSWSIMETIISVCGLIGVLLINLLA